MQYHLNQVFSHSPKEFNVSTVDMEWEPPCWIQLGLCLKAASEAANNEFPFGLELSHSLDAFSKTSHDKQLSSIFWSRGQYITNHYRDDWYHALIDWHELLKEKLKHLDGMFNSPFHFVDRNNFFIVDLSTILREDPKTMEIYLAEEKGSYADYNFLRIHSGIGYSLPRQHLWFQKRLSMWLQTEDVLPWFIETIKRLPKKYQPSNIQEWQNRFLDIEPHFSPPPSGEGKPWLEKPKVILVFGATHKVGYRSLFHLERSRFTQIKRQKEILTIPTSIKYGGSPEIVLDWTFHLITTDATAAQRVEKEILSGKKTHFGLNVDIVGMIARGDDVIQAINVPESKICEICLVKRQSLIPNSGPREKHKIFCITIQSSEPSP